MDIKKLLFCMLAFCYIATMWGVPTTKIDGIEYCIRNGYAYIWDRDNGLSQKGDEVTIPKEITVKGIESVKDGAYEVAGFFEQRDTSLEPSAKYPAKWLLPKVLTLPSSCTDYVIEFNDFNGNVEYEYHKLDYFILNKAQNLAYINIVPGGLYSSYGGALYNSKLQDTEKDALMAVPKDFKGKLVIKPECPLIYDEVCIKVNGLTELILSPNTINIGKNAFANCKELISVSVAKDVPENQKEARDKDYIHQGAFNNCIKLKEISIPDRVTYISSEDVFKNCSALTTIILPRDMKSGIGGTSLSGCKELSAFIIPDDALNFESNDGCLYTKGLYTLVNAPFKITTYKSPRYTNKIGKGAFSGNENIQSVILSEGVETIEDDAFNGCSQLTDVEFSPALTSIGESAFFNCINLLDIVLPNGLKTLGESCFANSSEVAAKPGYRDLIRTIVLPNSLTKLPKYAFEYNTIEKIEFGKSLEIISWCAFYKSKWSEGIQINFPSSLKKIEDLAFYAYHADDIVEIPYLSLRNVEDIGDSSLRSFYPKEIYVGSTPPSLYHFEGSEDYAFNKETFENTILYIPVGTRSLYESKNWKKFKHIVESDNAAVNEISNDSDFDITINGTELNVSTGEGVRIEVFATDGHCVYNAVGNVSLSLPSGMYIIRTAGKTRKIML